MSNETIKKTIAQEYKYGFTTNIEQIKFEPGLDEEVIKKLSKIKNEPKWLLNWRLKAYKNWKKMKEPTWANIHYGPIDYQALSYYAAPKIKSRKNLDEVDPEILDTYNKLGISLNEQKRLEGDDPAKSAYLDGIMTNLDKTFGKLKIQNERKSAMKQSLQLVAILEYQIYMLNLTIDKFSILSKF